MGFSHSLDAEAVVCSMVVMYGIVTLHMSYESFYFLQNIVIFGLWNSNLKHI